MALSDRRPARRRFTLLAAVGTLAAAGGATLLIRAPPTQFVIPKSPGHSGCDIEEGWTADQVSHACGAPKGGGTQPKIGARTSGTNLTLCSAPCEVFGETLVLYGCDGKVWETQPLTGRWRCSISGRDEGWERGDP